MEAVKACDWRNNVHELQDILDTKSVACGYHCAIYLLAKTLLQISVDHINIYPNEGCNQEDNDTFAVHMGEEIDLQTSQETITQKLNFNIHFEK